MLQENQHTQKDSKIKKSRSISANRQSKMIDIFLDSTQKTDINIQYRLFQEFYENNQDIVIDFLYLKEFFSITLSECPSDGEIMKIQKKLNNRRFSNNFKTSWSQEEKKVLIWIVGKYCQSFHKNPRFLSDEDFNHMSNYFIRRSAENIKLKWLSMHKTSLIAQPFTQDEDQLLQMLYEKFKDSDNKWKLISSEMNTANIVYRTGKQLRERWINYLDPKLVKMNDPWTDREDLELVNQIQQKGRKWTDISKYLKRNENQVKNRFNCLLKREDIDDDLNKLIDKILWRISKQPTDRVKEQGQRVSSTNNISNSLHLTIGNVENISNEELLQLTPCLLNVKTNTIYFPSIQLMQDTLHYQQQFLKDDFDRIKREFEIFDLIPYHQSSSISIILEEQHYSSGSKHPPSLSQFQELQNSEISQMQQEKQFYPCTPILSSVRKKYFKYRSDITIQMSKAIDRQLQSRSLPQILAY